MMNSFLVLLFKLFGAIPEKMSSEDVKKYNLKLCNDSSGVIRFQMDESR